MEEKTTILISREDRDYLRFHAHGYNYPIQLPVITKGSREETGAWTWNGSLDAPTLKPSIRSTHPGGTMTHIWLTDGFCQYLDDSTDGFAGQILPLIKISES